MAGSTEAEGAVGEAKYEEVAIGAGAMGEGGGMIAAALFNVQFFLGLGSKAVGILEIRGMEAWNLHSEHLKKWSFTFTRVTPLTNGRCTQLGSRYLNSRAAMESGWYCNLPSATHLLSSSAIKGMMVNISRSSFKCRGIGTVRNFGHIMFSVGTGEISPWCCTSSASTPIQAGFWKAT